MRAAVAAGPLGIGGLAHYHSKGAQGLLHSSCSEDQNQGTSQPVHVMAEEWVLTRSVLKRARDTAPLEQADTHLRIPAKDAKTGRATATGPGHAQEDSNVASEFQRMRKDVTAFGAAHLAAKRQKKDFDTRSLEQLGFAADKPQRVGACTHCAAGQGGVYVLMQAIRMHRRRLRCTSQQPTQHHKSVARILMCNLCFAVASSFEACAFWRLPHAVLAMTANHTACLCSVCRVATIRSTHAGARIGRSMASKQRQRQQQAEEEAIEAGMLRKKGRGKRRENERRARRESGLHEASNFSAGLMRVSKEDIANTTRPSGAAVSLQISKGKKRGTQKGGAGRGQPHQRRKRR